MGAEKRRCKRIPITMHLEVSSLFKQDNVHVKNINAPVEITDISRNGIGFITKSVMPIVFYFNSRLEFEKKNDCLNCVVQIVRRKQKEDGTTVYGCEFVGMRSIFDYIFDDIENEYSKCHSDEDGENE